MIFGTGFGFFLLTGPRTPTGPNNSQSLRAGQRMADTCDEAMQQVSKSE
jgi:hypothetical protein